MKTKPISLAGITTARLDEYYGLWAIEPTRGLSMFDRAGKLDLRSHVETTEKPRPTAGLKNIRALTLKSDAPTMPDDSVDDSEQDDEEDAQTPAGTIAVLTIAGTLMKQQSSMDQSTSTVVLRRQLRSVKDDPRYAGAILCIDSPGGSVAGTSDLASDIAALAAAKPVIGLAEDLCASAAYWAGSQCTELYANNNTALIGSIGTFIGTYDYSKMCEQEGIEAKVYATGTLKGAGFPGAAITDEQDTYFQNIVDETQKYFAQGVASGRGLSIESVNKVATGAVFLAGEAQDAGLIDGIKKFDQCLERMGELLAQRQATSPGITAGAALETRMNSESGTPAANAGTGSAGPNAPATDTKADLKRYISAFGNIGATWYVEGKTFEEATALHNEANTAAMAELKKENAQLRAENDRLQTRVRELRGEATPVSAELEKDETAKASTNPASLENRLGNNLARVARSIQLPKNNTKNSDN